VRAVPEVPAETPGRRRPCLYEQFERVHPAVGAGHPTNVPGGIEPDLGGHQGQQASWGRPKPDNLAFQIGDVANTLPREQFEAADMDASQHDDRGARLDQRNTSKRREIVEIELAAQNGVLLLGSRRLDIPDIGEALGPRQLLGQIFGGNADAAVIHQSDSGRFQCFGRGHYMRRAVDARRACRRECLQEPASGVRHWHSKSPRIERSRLELAFELVQEAPIRGRGDDLLRA
jgi:hypothetical protein